jgi:hypothetical protein
MLGDEFDKLLQKQWSENDKQVIERIKNNSVYYQKFLSASVKKDIIHVLNMCNNIKSKYEECCKKNPDICSAE